MTPDIQALLQQAQAAQQQAAHQAQFIAYTTYAAVLVCAVFSVLIFWKLCQIRNLLAASSPDHPPQASQARPTRALSTPDATPSISARDDHDTRYKPRG